MPLTLEDLTAFLDNALDTDAELHEDTALFTSGLLDSVLMQELIMFFEEKTGTRVPAADVTLENFDTPGAIVAYARSVS